MVWEGASRECKSEKLLRIEPEYHFDLCCRRCPTSVVLHSNLAEYLNTYSLANFEGQVDHAGDDRWCISCIESPVDSPLKDDQEVHVSEEKDKEDELWNEFEDKIDQVAEVKVVSCLYENTQSHVGNCYDD